MMFDRAGGLHSLLVFLQIALALSLYSVLVAVFHFRGYLDFERYVLYGLVVAAALALEHLKRDRFTIRTVLFDRSLLRLHPVALRQTGAVLVALVLFVTLLKDQTLSRIFLATFLAALYPLLLYTSRDLPYFCAGRIFRGSRAHRTLLIGSSKEVPRVKSWLENRRQLGFTTAGILCDDESAPLVHELRNLGEAEDLERVIRAESVHQVIVLGLPLILHRHSHIVCVCNRLGVRLAILSDLEARLQHPVVYLEDDGLNFLTMRQEPLENPSNRIFKRLLDIAAATLVTIFILPPAALLVWLLQRWQSPGPLLHRQTRSGLQNRHFEILKFRTMHVGEFNEAQQAGAHDERIFPAGRWLRKLSIDELPQFINVLRGDMSVVGPRPHLVEHNSVFAQHLESYHIRAFIRPGITGLAQVRGFRGEATPEAIAARLASDLFYLEKWSLFLDLSIFFRTIWQMLRPPKTAY